MLGNANPRTCYYISVTEHDESGYVPCLVTEGEPGYQVLSGNGEASQPWRWGKTYEEAKATCARQNLGDFGLTEVEALRIVASSIGAQNDRWSP
jgi:hypothetical protein